MPTYKTVHLHALLDDPSYAQFLDKSMRKLGVEPVQSQEGWCAYRIELREYPEIMKILQGSTALDQNAVHPWKLKAIDGSFISFFVHDKRTNGEAIIAVPLSNVVSACAIDSTLEQIAIQTQRRRR